MYIYIYNYLHLWEQATVIWNLPDGGSSHSGSLLGPSESMQVVPEYQSSSVAPECLATEYMLGDLDLPFP
jgi:hypothetical protein